MSANATRPTKETYRQQLRDAVAENGTLKARAAELDRNVHAAGEINLGCIARIAELESALYRIKQEDSCDTIWEGETCLDTHPGQPSEWCSHCIASEALNQ